MRYPLPIVGPADWRRNRAVARIALPDVPAGHIIAASFASVGTPQPFRFRLDCAAGRFESAAFGRATRQRQRQRGTGVRVPVDYFDADRDLERVALRLHCPARPPRDYLLCICIRPRTLPPPNALPKPAPLLPASSLSQTTAPEQVRRQACSPTAAAMALGVAGRNAYHGFIDDAWHQPTALCGVWPQNIWAAARRGRLAAVELAHDWTLAQAALGRGSAVVASIRFDAGALDGSPMAATDGHLVLLRGIDGGTVLVNDPAAPPGSVERRYDARQFAAAWMRHRGASYVFADAGCA